MIIDAWTDGSCHHENRVGGWGAVIRLQGSPFIGEIFGTVHDTTSQRMELTALLGVLQYFESPMKITIHSDSAYMINCIHQKWIDRWLKNGWLNSKGDPVSNKDLWISIHELLDFHQVAFVKVKGHTGVEFNERADVLADKGRKAGLASME